MFENYCSSDTQDGLNTHFHDAQWVRKHWDLDMDFDTESEEDSAFEDELSSSPDEHEISQVVDGTRPQPCGPTPTKEKKDLGFLVEDWSEESQEPSEETQQAQGVVDGEEVAGDHQKIELAMPPRWSSCLIFSKIGFSPGWRWI